MLQGVLDFAGFIPGLAGPIADGLNALVSGARGVAAMFQADYSSAIDHFLNTVFNGIALVLPLIGNHVKGAFKAIFEATGLVDSIYLRYTAQFVMDSGANMIDALSGLLDGLQAFARTSIDDMMELAIKSDNAGMVGLASVLRNVGEGLLAGMDILMVGMKDAFDELAIKIDNIFKGASKVDAYADAMFVKGNFDSKEAQKIIDCIKKGELNADEVAELSNRLKARGDSAADDVIQQLDEIVTNNFIGELLKQTTCNTNELTNYLKKIDAYKGTNYADEFAASGKWPNDVQIPKTSSVLKADGNIDWSQVPNDGFAVVDGVLDRNPYDIQLNEVIDRYGPSNGRFTSPVLDGKPYTYDQRSLPYIEDASKYHQYRVTGDFSNIESYITNLDDLELKADIEAFMDYKELDFKDLVTYKGKIADGFGVDGGGIQYQLPLPIDMLIDLKLLEVVK